MPNEHDHLVSMMNQLIDEREILSRENEYLKSKLNESVLVETINEMKKERDLLFKLLSNLTMNCSKDDHIRFIKRFVKENPKQTRHNHQSKPNLAQQQQPIGLSKSITHLKHPQSNKKILVYKPEGNKIIRKSDVQLKHSQNSPFQRYRSQSLQDLT